MNQSVQAKRVKVEADSDSEDDIPILARKKVKTDKVKTEKVKKSKKQKHVSDDDDEEDDESDYNDAPKKKKIKKEKVGSVFDAQLCQNLK